MANIIETKEGKHIVDTGLPQKYIKSQWLELHRDLNRMIMESIKDPNASNSKAITIRMMKYHIALILDIDRRNEIKAKVEKLKKERLVDVQSADEKMDILETIYFEATEDITDYIDTAFGVSHRLAIGID